MTKRTVLCAIAVLCALGISAPAGQADVQKTNANGEIQMLNPRQKIQFNVQTTSVEYWNYDYPAA